MRKIVATITEDSYMRYTYITMESLLKNTEIDEIYIVSTDEISDYSKSIFSNMLSKYGCVGQYLAIADLPKEFSDTIWKKSIWLKLMLLSVMPASVERFLYLDSDILVRKNISGLFDMGMDDACIAGCVDNNLARNYKDYLATKDLIPRQYINAGVLLIDLKNIASQGIKFEECLKVISENDELKFADQDVWNIVFRNRIKYLDSFIYNFSPAQYDSDEIIEDRLYAETAIVHYAGCKPWIFREEMMFIDEFWSYADASPYKDDIHRDYDDSVKAYLDVARSYEKGFRRSSRFSTMFKAWTDIYLNGHHIGDWLKKKNMKKISIYGAGDSGKKLVKDLNDCGIKIDLIIDKSSKANDYKGIKIMSPDEMSIESDCVIITPIMDYNRIRDDIEEKYKGNIFSLETIILDYYK